MLAVAGEKLRSLDRLLARSLVRGTRSGRAMAWWQRRHGCRLGGGGRCRGYTPTAAEFCADQMCKLVAGARLDAGQGLPLSHPTARAALLADFLADRSRSIPSLRC